MPTQWKTVRVFISSTFRDMHAERDHLIKAVFPKLRQWCEARRIRLIDLDLRWGVTQDQADNGRAIEICLKEIDGSRPFFVCLLGNRYGYVPDPPPPEEEYRFQTIQRDPHKSITHLEIIHAALSPIEKHVGAKEKTCPHSFFYFRDPECIPQPEAVAAAHRDEHRNTFYETNQERELQLAALKQEIRDKFDDENRICTYSGDWESFASNPEDDTLIGRLTGLTDFGMQVEADLQWAIAQEHNDHIAALQRGVHPLDEEAEYHEVFIENRTQVHVPRKSVEQQLTDYVASGDNRPLVLSGPPGSGKSAILAHWISERRHANRPEEFLLPRFIGASPRSITLTKLLSDICAEFLRRFDLQETTEEKQPDGTTTSRTQPMTVPPDPAEVLQKWPNFLDAVKSRSSIILVIDALNQLDSSSDAAHLFWLPRQLPSNVRLIVSVLDHGAKSSKDHRPGNEEPSDWLSVIRRIGLSEIAVPMLDGTPGAEAERRQIIRDFPNVFAKTLAENDVVQLLKNPATQNPLYLTVALEELRVFGSHKQLSDRIRQLPQAASAKPGDIDHALDAMFLQVLRRIDDDEYQRRHAPGLVPAIFRYLACAKEVLSEDELSALLAKRLENIPERIRNDELQIVLRQVRPYLMRKAHPQGTLIDFYHRSFWKAVNDRSDGYLKTNADRIETHQTLADDYFATTAYYVELPDPNDSAQTVRTPNTRKAIELPHHLIAARDAVKTYQLFTDLPFLESKTEAVLTFELLRDFDAAQTLFPIDSPPGQALITLALIFRASIYFISVRAPSYRPTILQAVYNAITHSTSTPSMSSSCAHEASALTLLRDIVIKWSMQHSQPLAWIRALTPVTLQSIQSGMTIPTPSRSIILLRLCNSGKVLVGVDERSDVYLWSVEQGDLLCTLPLSGDAVHPLAISTTERSQHCTIALSNGELWTIDVLAQALTLVYVSDSPPKMSALSDDPLICAEIAENAITATSIPLRRRIFAVDRETNWPSGVTMSSNGNVLCAYGLDGTVRVFSLVDDSYTRVYYSSMEYISRAALSHNSLLLCYGTGTGGVELVDMSNGNQLQLSPDYFCEMATAILFTENDNVVLVGRGDGQINAYSTNNSSRWRHRMSHESSVNALDSTSCGSIAVSSSRGCVKIWRSGEKACNAQFGMARRHKYKIEGFIATTHPCMAVVWSYDAVTIIEIVRREDMWHVSRESRYDFATSHNIFRRQITFCDDGSVVWQDLITGVVKRFVVPDVSIRCFGISSGERLAASWGSDAVLRVWDVATLQVRSSIIVRDIVPTKILWAESDSVLVGLSDRHSVVIAAVDDGLVGDVTVFRHAAHDVTSMGVSSCWAIDAATSSVYCVRRYLQGCDYELWSEVVATLLCKIPDSDCAVACYGSAYVVVCATLSGE